MCCLYPRVGLVCFAMLRFVPLFRFVSLCVGVSQLISGMCVCVRTSPRDLWAQCPPLGSWMFGSLVAHRIGGHVFLPSRPWGLSDPPNAQGSHDHLHPQPHPSENSAESMREIRRDRRAPRRHRVDGALVRNGGHGVCVALRDHVEHIIHVGQPWPAWEITTHTNTHM